MAAGYTPSQYHKQAECAEVSQSEIVAARPIIDTDSPSNKATDSAKQEYQDKRDFAATCSDLTAQWTVADFTHRGFWLGLIGLGFLGWTLLETRKASMSARDAAKAGWEAVEATKLGVRAEFQPYIEIGNLRAIPADTSEIYHFMGKPSNVYETGEWEDDMDTRYYLERDGKLNVKTNITIKNKGKSPANDLYYTCTAIVHGRNGADKTDEFKVINAKSGITEQLDADSEFTLRLTFSFHAIDVSENPVLRESNSVILDVKIRFSFLDYMSGNKRRVYTASYYGNLKHGLLSKNRFTETQAIKQDNPPKNDFGSIFGVTSTTHSIPSD